MPVERSGVGMAETLRGEVLYVVAPEELDEYDLEEEVRTLAESRYLLVCREGGAPSWFEKVRMFVSRTPIEAVTLVADSDATEGQVVTATVEETGITGVYEATDIR